MDRPEGNSGAPAGGDLRKSQQIGCVRQQIEKYLGLRRGRPLSSLFALSPGYAT